MPNPQAVDSKISGDNITLAEWTNQIQGNLNYELQQGADLASASTITVTNRVHKLTGTTTVNTITAGSLAGQQVTLVASGQASGVCVVLAHHGGNIALRDGQNLGIYAGESLTFMWDGTYWTEIGRNLKLVLDEVSITAQVNVTATTEATATTIITGNAVTYDGATRVSVEAKVPNMNGGTAFIPVLYDGASIGWLSEAVNAGANGWVGSRRLVPSAGSHTFSFRGYVSSGSGTVNAGTGGTGNVVPATLRVTRDL